MVEKEGIQGPLQGGMRRDEGLAREIEGGAGLTSDPGKKYRKKKINNGDKTLPGWMMGLILGLAKGKRVQTCSAKV